MIRWRYVDFTMMQFRVGTATHADVAPSTFNMRVLRFANGVVQFGDTHWRVDPIFGMGYPPEVALAWKVTTPGATGNAAWEVAMHSHEDQRNISMPFTFHSLADAAVGAGARVFMTDFIPLSTTGYPTPADNLWWSIRVQRNTVGDTISDAIELMNFSLRYRVER